MAWLYENEVTSNGYQKNDILVGDIIVREGQIIFRPYGMDYDVILDNTNNEITSLVTKTLLIGSL